MLGGLRSWAGVYKGLWEAEGTIGVLGGLLGTRGGLQGGQGPIRVFGGPGDGQWGQ